MKYWVIICFFISQAFAYEPPPFTPNVVDPNQYLTASEIEQVNKKIDEIRTSANVWAAVYIMDQLPLDETIEDVANKTFNTWGLGEKGVDNGLLLVLAMQDRKSRLEVGYGLEGSITDLLARIALDDHLAPLLREGKRAEAIIATFDYVAKIQTDSEFARREREGPTLKERLSDKKIWPFLIFLYLLWINPIVIWFFKKRSTDYLKNFSHEDVQEYKKMMFVEGKSGLPLGLKFFLTLNPGAFIIVLPMFFPIALYIIMGLLIILGGTITLRKLKPYLSKEAFADNFRKLRLASKSNWRMKYVEEISPGVFSYSPNYYTSQEYKTWKSSRSSSGGSRSSSSGGGRSGGGGSSSSW